MIVWVFMWEDMVESPMCDNSMSVIGVYSSKELAETKVDEYKNNHSGHWYLKAVKIDT